MSGVRAVPSVLCCLHYEERHDRMNEQHDANVSRDQIHTASQGLRMFKEHVAAMKRGPRLLGGERETVEQRGVSGGEDK